MRRRALAVVLLILAGIGSAYYAATQRLAQIFARPDQSQERTRVP